MPSLENEVNELESEKGENKAERVADSPEEESIEDMQERMAAEADTMRKQMEEFANPDSVVEEVSHDVDLPKEVAEEEAKAMGLEEKLDEIKTEEKQAESELTEATINAGPARPPVPPLKAEQPSVADQEKLEQELKLKTEKYNKFRDQVMMEIKKKAESPENPVNKLDKEVAKRLCIEAGESDFEQRLKQSGLDEEKFLAIMPDLYKKGTVSPDDYANYIAGQAWKGNNLNFEKISSIIENTPAEIMINSFQANGFLKNALNTWWQKSDEKIKGYLADTKTQNNGDVRIANPEAALKLAASMYRFTDKGEATKKEMKTIAEDYVKSYLNYNRLASKVGSGRDLMAVENLFEGGFAGEASMILKKAIEKQAVSGDYVVELQEKGYLTNDQARDLLDTPGMLKG